MILRKKAKVPSNSDIKFGVKKNWHLILTIFGLSFSQPKKTREGGQNPPLTWLCQIKWLWNLLWKYHGSKRFKLVKKIRWYPRHFNVKMSSSFWHVATTKKWKAFVISLFFFVLGWQVNFCGPWGPPPRPPPTPSLSVSNLAQRLPYQSFTKDFDCAITVTSYKWNNVIFLETTSISHSFYQIFIIKGQLNFCDINFQFRASLLPVLVFSYL